MRRKPLCTLGIGVLVVFGAVQAQQRPATQPRTTPVPRLEAVAETRLLMEGLAEANMRGLERLLSTPPESADAWVYARGQALLVAETGNLLLLRPPRNQGRDTWQQQAMDLRAAATALARDLASRDLENSRGSMLVVAAVCNRCHQTFQVQKRITPFRNPPERQP